MMKQVLIPLAAFAITATGASAFDGELLRKLDIDLSDEQVAAFEEAHELRLGEADRGEVRAVLEEAGIDQETMQEVREATREYREEMREKVHAALENNDYEAFLEAIEGSPLEDVIDTEQEFKQFLEAFDLRESGDYEDAREIMNDLGLERPIGYGHAHNMRGMGPEGQFQNGNRDGSGDGFGSRGGGKGFGGRGMSN